MYNKQKIMLKLKKIWLSLLWTILSVWITFLCNPCLWALSNWNPIIPPTNTNTDPKINQKNVSSIEGWSHWMSEESKWILHLPKPGDYNTWLWYVIALIQIAINRLLWILAIVALIYMMYCGFLILSSWSDETKAWKGKKWISTAAIALAWIGLSRLIVSAILRFITIMANK